MHIIFYIELASILSSFLNLYFTLYSAKDTKVYYKITIFHYFIMHISNFSKYYKVQFHKTDIAI